MFLQLVPRTQVGCKYKNQNPIPPPTISFPGYRHLQLNMDQELHKYLNN